jgi:4'-phosphopantetheinyl transferase
MDLPAWQAACHNCVQLEPGDIHVWTIDLQSGTDAPALVTADDLSRSREYVFARDQGRFLQGRAALRRILGKYTGTEPRELCFEAGEWGKPSLSGWADLRFNVSHSGDTAACAVARTEVGIDVQEIRPLTYMLQIAQRYFSPLEALAITELDAGGQTDAFFRCWTRKEAYLKACGRGLSVPLSSFTVSLDADSPRLLQSEHGDVDRWQMRNVPARGGYKAALAVDISTVRPSRFVLHQLTAERN